MPLRVITSAARQVEGEGYARREGMQLVLTERGAEAVVRLSEAREESLAELLGDWWGPDRPTDLVRLVSELSAEVSGSSRSGRTCPNPARTTRRADRPARTTRRADRRPAERTQSSLANQCSA